MIYCEQCGVENADKGQYCKSCGGKLNSAHSEKPVSFVPPSNQSIGFGERRTGERLVLKCTLCGGQDFARDKGRLDSKWGWTSFKVIMMSCKQCGHIELFNKGRSIWDFD
jgi:hypothetical protein